MTPTAVLGCLMEQSFNLRDHGTRAIGDLVRILRDVTCYSLSFGDLDEATVILRELLAA
jgi:hypothetical protein